MSWVQNELTIWWLAIWVADNDGVKLQFVHPGGNELMLQACSLPVTVGRQARTDGSYREISWKLAEARFHSGLDRTAGSEVLYMCLSLCFCHVR